MNDHPERVAMVEWIDIEDCTSPAWVPRREAKRDAKTRFKPLFSVGYVIYEDDERICLASTWGPDTSGVLKLPKGICKSIVYLDVHECS